MSSVDIVRKLVNGAYDDRRPPARITSNSRNADWGTGDEERQEMFASNRLCRKHYRCSRDQVRRMSAPFDNFAQRRSYISSHNTPTVFEYIYIHLGSHGLP